jgi:hypothetical protein
MAALSTLASVVMAIVVAVVMTVGMAISMAVAAVASTVCCVVTVSAWSSMSRHGEQALARTSDFKVELDVFESFDMATNKSFGAYVKLSGNAWRKSL